MPLQQINLGNYANDGTGDDLRTAFTKVNANFTELSGNANIVNATNVGSGVGIFAQRNLTNLEFKTLTSNDNSIAITPNVANVNLRGITKVESDLAPKLGANLLLNGQVINGQNGTGDILSPVWGLDVRYLNSVSQLLIDSNNVNINFGSFPEPNTNPIDMGGFVNTSVGNPTLVGNVIDFGLFGNTNVTSNTNGFSGNYNDLTNKPVLFSGYYSDLLAKPTLAAVATSGDYNDLTNKPTVSLVNGSVLKDTGDFAIAFGLDAGLTSQGAQAVAIGFWAGQTQGQSAVAIGGEAGKTSQGSNTVAIGSLAGRTSQGANAVAIGNVAGRTSQGSSAVAIGINSGNTSQGTNAVAIGCNAGVTNQPANTIIINASGVTVNGVSAQTDSFYVAPIRSTTGTPNLLYYNTSTKEVTYGPGITGNTTLVLNTASSTTVTPTISITAGNINTLSSSLSAGNIDIRAGNALGLNNQGGSVNITAGNGNTSSSGNVNIVAGNIGSEGSPGVVNITGGGGGGDPATSGGYVKITGGAGYGNPYGNVVIGEVIAGGFGGDVVLSAGDTSPNNAQIVLRGADGLMTIASPKITITGSVGIGTSSPSASSILDAQSTTKGVRMPNMTTAQKNAIVSPAAGLMVFDTTLNKLCVYTGAAWQTITSI
jgi:hypothetical protein